MANIPFLRLLGLPLVPLLTSPTIAATITVGNVTIIFIAALMGQRRPSEPSSIPVPRLPSYPPKQPKGLDCSIC